MSAFGPFAGAESVDFESLGPEALFLIHGATGSGKSTILDAMCFALYGQSLGGERSGEQLRSDHAEPTVFTQVQFDFAVGSRRYRVLRSPEQVRMKKSGKGTTVENPKATLTDLDADGKPLAEGSRKVDEAIAKVLGFACEDFRQVVMLPQGRFRELLSAGSKERQKVLARIFHTERFKDLIDRLKKAHKALEAQAGQGQALVKQLLAGADVEEVEGLATRIRNGQLECAKLEQELDVHSTLVEKAEGDLKKLEEGKRLVDEYKAALSALEAAQADAPRTQIMKERLSLARNAEPLAPRLSALENTRDGLAGLVGQVASAEAAASKSEQALKEAQEARDKALDLERGLPALREDEQKLSGLGEILQTLKALKATVTDRVERAEQAGLLSKKQRHIAEDLGSKLSALEKRIALRRSQEVQGRRMDAQRKRVDHASRRAAYDLSLKAAAEVIALKQGQVDALSAELAETETAAKEARRAQIRDLAGSLAADLETDEACPVCGSTEHPSPAEQGKQTVSQSHVDALSEQIETLTKARAGAGEAVSLEKQRVEGIKGQRNALDVIEAPLEQLKEELRGIELGFQSAQEGRSLEQLEGEVPGIQVQLEAAQAASNTAYGDALLAKQDLKRDREALREAEGRLPGEFRSVEQIEAQMAQLAARIQSIDAAVKRTQGEYTDAVAEQGRSGEALKQLLQQQATAKSAVDKEEALVEQALRGAGFENKAAWKGARLAGAEQDALEGQITQAEVRLQASVAGVERTRSAAQGVNAEGNLEAKTQAVGEARQARDKALHRLAQFQKALEQLQSTLDRVKTLQAQSSEIEERYAVAGQLADVAKGKNPAKLDFERYVLGVMLDDVLQSSAQRLKTMSRGRYTLHRSLSLEDGRRVAGLDLDVMDHWTGISRSVSTLSGGEGFLAALALALGLADVIQSYTGGIHLEAVFIDEGFGSLDPEALEMAMRALEDLRESGRMVGLISHVGELKERIDTRLEVTRSRNGSSITVVRS
jgi:exonuclease SbcC